LALFDAQIPYFNPIENEDIDVRLPDQFFKLLFSFFENSSFLQNNIHQSINQLISDKHADQKVPGLEIVTL